MAISRRIRRFWNRVDARLIPLVARSPRLSSWYYALFDRSFDREHQAVLNGRLLWERSRTGPVATNSLLRRNTHRLEKGLLMRPRRDVFALDYIQETVDFYCRVARDASSGDGAVNEEIQWTSDVLEQYFQIAGSHPLIDRLRTQFKQAHEPGPASRTPLVPYRRDLTRPPSVSFEELLELAHRRRSVRWFENQRVPRDLIEKAVSIASLSPSACNRQPYIFRVFDDPEVVPQVAGLPGGTTGFAQQFPAIVVLIGELRNYYGERDRHLIYIDASLAAMSFVYAAETLGLGTCCINWPDIEVDEARAVEMLKLEPDQRPIMFIAVGFPDAEGMVAYSQKKSNASLIRYNFE